MIGRLKSVLTRLWPWTGASDEQPSSGADRGEVVVTQVIDFVNLPENQTQPSDPDLWQRVSRVVYRWFQRFAPNERTLNRRLGAAGLGLIGLSYFGLLWLFIVMIAGGVFLAVGAPGLLAGLLAEASQYLTQIGEALPTPIAGILGAIPALPLVGVFWVPLALLGLSLLFVARRVSLTSETPGETRIDWLTLPRVNVSRALDHLAGPTGNGNLDGGEVVVARLTASFAEDLMQIPERLTRRVRPAWLHPVLIAVEGTSYDRIATVADKYSMTLLVDESMIPEIRTVLAVLCEGWGKINERQEFSGVGTATIQRIDPYTDGPTIDDNLAGGRGEPLHENQTMALRGHHPPSVVIGLAPAEYIDTVQQKLEQREQAETRVEVREWSQTTVTIVRLYLYERFYWEQTSGEKQIPGKKENIPESSDTSYLESPATLGE